MSDGSGEMSTPGDSPGDGSLAWGWLGSVAVVALTALVLVGAAVRTPGVPDCQGYSAAGWLLFCPWVRAFVVESLVLIGVAVVASTIGGLVVGCVRLATRWRND